MRADKYANYCRKHLAELKKINITAAAAGVEAESGGDIRCLRMSFYDKCITRICLTSETKVKVTEYNVRNGSVRLKIYSSIKVIVEHFRKLSLFSKFMTLKV